MTDSWTDQIVGERMTVDRDFASRVADSRFSNQEWSLIMTATTFEIEQPTDPDAARLVANTDKVEHVIPEFESIRSQAGAMGGAPDSTGGDRAGIVSSIKSAIGLGDDGVSAEELEAAERLAQEYADELQRTLESKDRWDEVRELAASSTS